MISLSLYGKDLSGFVDAILCDRVTKPINSLLLVIPRSALLFFYYFAPDIFALRNFPV